ncbi:MAG: glycoside hydrolase family 3 C-terminal domain-containing protein [Clostridia bacterium]|nr:glycoside hydrolase family 3 C-terminal domain-containing protein [Clostridia bacterium]
MAKQSKRVLRVLAMVSSFGLAAALTTGVVMEQYQAPLDAFFDTLSYRVVSEKTDEADWIWESNFKSAKEAYEGWRDFAIKESHETFALLKNENSALPISKTAKVTLLGLRSYAPVYGNSGGSIADKKTVENGNRIYEAFAKRGFQLNPSMLKTYENYCNTLTWGGKGFGATPPEYKELAGTDEIYELSQQELAQYNAEYAKDFAEYNDAAIVVVGRPGGESKNYVPGGQDTTTGNVFGLSTEEKEIIAMAKENFDKVIVLVNSVCQMELGEIANDPAIDSILWIGYPGAHGFYGVADVLNGTVAPSAYLGDIYAANTAVNPAMMNFGAETPWANVDSFAKAENVNSYLVQAEGIYTGYRYYETRYADVVAGVAGAKTAKAGTYVNADGTMATVDGEWNYANEVTYPFGYGLSYTTFEQTLDNVAIKGDKKTAEVTVTVKNTGKVAGKSAIQLYAQTPYTEYDKQNNVEKAAIQLMDYEKTVTLEAGKSQTITMNVDLANLASYDYTNAKTYIVEAGDYYFAIGANSHDALNNILAAQGKTTANGMTANGDSSKTYKWTWNDFDAKTFSVAETGVTITNHLTEGEFAMDLNAFKADTGVTVEYLTRSNWNGSYPKKYDGITASGTLEKMLRNDFYELKNEDTSEYTWGESDSELTLNDMKLAEFDDPRWDEVIAKVTVEEFLAFAGNAFHKIAPLESVGYMGNNADDGPGGSDTHYLQEGSYKGTPYADAEEYTGYGSRVAPSPQNLAYSFNKELAYENGQIILGESTLVLGLPIMIGPGANLHRHAYNGRGGEYYSEDPILSGYTCSAVVQGAQSKGCLVNIKHIGFNDQEINRSGIAVFMTEQKAREMELRNLQQAFVANGKPASFVADETKADTYQIGALGVMSSYNRHGAVAASANKGTMQDILRDEWGFKGYNVTDFTGVSLKAAPKESLLYGTTAFCGFGSPSFDYWKKGAEGIEQTLSKDKALCAALKQDIHYVLYALANSAAINGTNNSTHIEQLWSTWRIGYTAAIGVTGLMTLVFTVAAVIPSKKEKEAK